MPIFEYECQGCGHIFEKVQVVRQQEDVAACPVCQASNARQLISRFSSPSGNGANMICAPSAIT